MSEPEKDKEAETVSEVAEAAAEGLAALIKTPLKENLADVAISMYLMLYPLDIFLNIKKNTDINNPKSDFFGAAGYEKYISLFAAKVAEKMGVDKADVLNPETRTPEQQQAIADLASAFAHKYAENFENCNYLKAKEILREIQTKYNNKGKRGLYNIKTAAALYFFATNTDILPDAADGLTEEHKAKLIEILHSLDDFFVKQSQSGKVQEAGGIKNPLLYDYIEANSPSFEETIEKTKLITKKIQEIEYPLDKVNTKLWGLQPGKQAALKAEKDNSEEQANIYLMLDFDELQNNISRPLTYYDKKVFLSVCNLKNNGNDIVTTTQIYKAMGNKSRPAASDREKILKSLKVMSMCRVSLDNTEEANLYPKYDKVKTDFYLLPTTIIEGYKNHHVIDDAIHILELPKLFIFSKNRKQITKAPIELLESPISQTEANLQLEDYLFRRIGQMKNKPELSKTIILETIYENCNINDRLKKSRLPDKITRILGHWKKIKWIKGYTIDDRCIKIAL